MSHPTQSDYRRIPLRFLFRALAGKASAREAVRAMKFLAANDDVPMSQWCPHATRVWR